MKLTDHDMHNPSFWYHRRRAQKAVDAVLIGTTADIPTNDKVAKAASDAVDALTKAALLRDFQLSTHAAA